MTAIVADRKIGEQFRGSANQPSAKILPLPIFRTNEEILRLQIATQIRLQEEALAGATAPTAKQLAQQHQKPRKSSMTARQQAAMQGRDGFAFKI